MNNIAARRHSTALSNMRRKWHARCSHGRFRAVASSLLLLLLLLPRHALNKLHAAVMYKQHDVASLSAALKPGLPMRRWQNVQSSTAAAA